MAHYRQSLRCRERGEPVVLTALRGFGSPLVVEQVRLSQRAAKVLATEAARREPTAAIRKHTISSVAREVLEAWAAAREKALPAPVRKAAARKKSSRSR